MLTSSAYKILRIPEGSSKDEIKKAYRKLVKIYHPDHNKSPDAAKRFQEIMDAYNMLIKHEPRPYQRDESYAHAAEILRKEREKARQFYRTSTTKQGQWQPEEKPLSREWKDVILILNYFGHGLLLVVATGLIILPVVLGFVYELTAAIATSYLIIIGSFLLLYIWGKRKTWFKLGKVSYTFSDLRALFRMPLSHPGTDYCCYIKGEKADGKPYTLRLVQILDIKTRSMGGMNHESTIKRKTVLMHMPRSMRAQRIHRLCSYVKGGLIILSLIFVPFGSLFWRMVAGIILGALASLMILKLSRVKGKTSYLFTPAFLIKSGVWLIVLLFISNYGQGFIIELSDYKFLAMGGLFFLLDIVFDLFLGFFPFYPRLFKPLIKQGNRLSQLYKEGFQNYIEYPVYSMVYPFFRWIF